MIISNQLQVYVLCIAYICESMNLYCLYPVTTFLLVNFKVIDNVNSAGYYSGLFTAIYSFAQILACGYWGKLSDVIGKKNIIMIGLISSAVSYLVLGMSSNIYIALFARFVAGLLSANSPILKSFVGQLSNDTNKGTNYGYMTIAWSVGIIIGALLGGNTYNILFPQYPILILCLLISIVYLVCALIIQKLIPDNNANINIMNEIQMCTYDIPLIDIYQYAHDKYVINAILLYVAITIIDISISEVLPLWMALSSTKGGLGYKSENISYVLSISACIGLLSQPMYIGFEKCVTRTNIFNISSIVNVITMVMIPYVGTINSEQFIMLCVVNIIRYIFVCCIFNVVYTTISSSASQTHNETTNIGHINGIAQSCGSVCKVLCPILINPLFSTFSQNNNSYFNCHFVFNLLGLLSIIPYIITFYIDKTKVNAIKEQQPEQSANV